MPDGKRKNMADARRGVGLKAVPLVLRQDSRARRGQFDPLQTEGLNLLIFCANMSDRDQDRAYAAPQPHGQTWLLPTTTDNLDAHALAPCNGEVL